MVNNKVYPFQSLRLLLPGGPVATTEDLNYDHEREHKPIMDNQGNFIGYTKGEFKGTVKIVMDRAEFELIVNNYAAKFGGMYNMPPIPVIASYGDLGQTPIVDTLEFKVSKCGDLGGKRGEQLKTTLEGPMTAIPQINGVPAYTPGL